MEIRWTGPYGWPKYEHENRLPSVPKHPGVYLWTVEYQDGYLIYAAGLTRRSIPIRLREHTRNFLNGEYNVLDIDMMQQGVRKEIWRGWGWSPTKQAEYKKKKQIIYDAARRQLAGFRIFVVDVGTQPRLLERLEASIMATLYKQPAPFCDIPDKGMMLAPRWDSENPIIVKSKCTTTLHGIPLMLEI